MQSTSPASCARNHAAKDEAKGCRRARAMAMAPENGLAHGLAALVLLLLWAHCV